MNNIDQLCKISSQYEVTINFLQSLLLFVQQQEVRNEQQSETIKVIYTFVNIVVKKAQLQKYIFFKIDSMIIGDDGENRPTRRLDRRTEIQT